MKRLLPFLAIGAVTLSAQSGVVRRATNVAALVTYAPFFHMRPVVVQGDLKLLDTGEMQLTTGGLSLKVVNESGSTPDGLVEVRGELWDIGELRADDPRLARYDLRRTFGVDPEGAWPRAGQVMALVASAMERASPPAAPSIRNIVLNPDRYLDQDVTIVGQFSGRNLLGDLPDAPGQSRWDFVLRSADAAIWVTNLRPRGKDFELALDSRIDTGRWVEVSGTLQQGRGLQWLNAEGRTVSITQAPKDNPVQSMVRVPAAPPPEVVFSAPTGGETDVLPTTNVRIQFSRDIDPATIRGHVAVRLASGAPAPAFTTQYLPGTRVLVIEFAEPLARFSTVTVELQDGIAGSDKQALVPWTLTFDTGT